jgi:hypothetical protein
MPPKHLFNMRLRRCSPGPYRALAAIMNNRVIGLAWSAVALLSTAGAAEAQQVSPLASITLSAHVSPGVRAGPAGLGATDAPSRGNLGLGSAAVNTAYRVELHASPGAEPTVLLREDRGGSVPWEVIVLELSRTSAAREPVVLDLVVRPTL